MVDLNSIGEGWFNAHESGSQRNKSAQSKQRRLQLIFRNKNAQSKQRILQLIFRANKFVTL
ncbi:hypothetical protein I3843_05G197300 [Carya illinoinensis]|nr:hypothetical protein I3843_05G197300 [Carya illinoinensis]